MESPSVVTLEAALEEVQFAHANVPFFQRHLDSAGLLPSDFRSAEDLRRLPPTRKADYRRNFPTGVLVQGATVSDAFVYKSQSSGTGGDRLITVAYSYDLVERMEATTSVHPQLQTILMSVTKQRACLFAAPNCSDVECATPTTTMQDRTLPDGTLVLPVSHDLLGTPTILIERALEEIETYRPHWFYADPTHFAFLVREFLKRGIAAPSCLAVFLGFTMATSVAKRQIQQFLFKELPVCESVSMSEVGLLAMECPFGRLHLNNSSYYLELLKDGRPSEPGEIAELYVTSLGDRLCPHIRYKTGDAYRLVGAACSCGHSFPVVRFEGRFRHMMMRKGKISATPREVDEIFTGSDGVDAYKVHQIDDDFFQLSLIPNLRFDDSQQAQLCAALQARLGRDVRLDAQVTSYLPSDRSGKFLSCTSEIAAMTVEPMEVRS